MEIEYLVRQRGCGVGGWPGAGGNCKALDRGELYSATCDLVDVTRPDLGRVEKVGYAIRMRIRTGQADRGPGAGG